MNTTSASLIWVSTRRLTEWSSSSIRIAIHQGDHRGVLDLGRHLLLGVLGRALQTPRDRHAGWLHDDDVRFERVVQCGDGAGETARDLAADASARYLLGLQTVGLDELGIDVDVADIVHHDGDSMPSIDQVLGQVDEEGGLPASQETCDLCNLH